MSDQLPDRDQVLSQLRQIIVDNYQLNEREVSSLRLDEPLIGGSLGFDSLDAVELGMYVEQEFGITLGNDTETRAALVSLASLANFIRARRQANFAFSPNPVTA